MQKICFLFLYYKHKIKCSILILFSRLKNEAPTKEQESVSEVNYVVFPTS